MGQAVSARTWWRTALIALGLGLGAGSASAHLAPPTMRADRTLTVSLGERTTLLYALRLSAPELARVRASADKNHDGTLSAEEATQLLGTWTAAVRANVSLASGRGRVGFTFPLDVKSFEIGREATGLEGPTEPPAAEMAPGARVAWTFDLRLAGGDDRLTLVDATSLLPIDHSEVFVRDSASRRLTGLGVDPAKLGVASQLSWVDAATTDKTRTIHLTWTPPPERPWWMVPLVIAIGLAIAGATLWSVRR